MWWDGKRRLEGVCIPGERIAGGDVKDRVLTCFGHVGVDLLTVSIMDRIFLYKMRSGGDAS